MTINRPGPQAHASSASRPVVGQLVAVVDGSLAGQWFTWADWRARLDAARYMAERTGRRDPLLNYVPAGAELAHPDTDRYPGVHGQSATYTQPSTHEHQEHTAGAGRGTALDPSGSDDADEEAYQQ